MTNSIRPFLSRPPVLWLFFAGVLAVNRISLSPAVGAVWGELAGNGVFILVRMLSYFLLALLLARVAGFTRFRAISAVALLVAVEHLGFNLVSLFSSYRSNPADYPEGLAGPLFGLFMSYMIALPVVLLVALVGHLLGVQARGSRGSGEA